MVDVKLRRKIQISAAGDVNVLDEEVAVSGRSSSKRVEQDSINLFYFPDYTGTNPYQDMLYSNLQPNVKAGYGSIDDAAKASSENSFVVFHLHWPEPLFANCSSTDDFVFLSTSFFEKMEFFQGNGGKLVVTMHNALPHDKSLEELWLKFYQKLLSMADKVHLHSASALSVLLGLYAFDEKKTLILPHGNYEGVYPNHLSRAEARTSLGLPEEALVYGFVGQLRPYKGLGKLVSAFRDARALIPESQLMIAGKPVHPVKPGYWEAIGRAQANLSVFEGYIGDHRLQYYFNAADVIVLPYTDILTSGSIMLAASFGKPMIFPDLETLAEEKAAGLGIVYDSKDPNGLLNALLQFSEAAPEQRAAFASAARRFSASRAWSRISDAFGKSMSAIWPYTEHQREVAGHDVTITVPDGLDPAGSIGIAVVSYHSVDDIEGMLSGLERAGTNKRLTLFILDNSGDGSDMAALRRLSADAVLIKSEQNLGYAGGNNIILSLMMEAGCAYGMIVNPDIRFEPGALDILVEMSEQHPDAILSPLVCKSENQISFAGGYVQRRADISISHFLDGADVAEAPLRPYAADVLNGCAVFAPMHVLEQMGPISESYFLYYEETDWFLRGGEKGIKYLVVPSARVNHEKRSHGKLVPSLYYLYYLTRSTFLMNAKFGGASDAVARRITSSFLKPWREKLTRSHPRFLAIFDRVMTAAIEDGQELAEGPIDIGDRIDDVHIAHNSDTVVGRVENADEEMIGGWIATPETSQENAAGHTSVWLIVDDVPLLEHAANIVPENASEAVKSSKSGFYFRTPKEILDGGVHKIEVRSSSGGMRLPFRAGGAKLYFSRSEVADRPVGSADIQARIDGIRDGKLVGWVMDKVIESRVVYFDIEIDGKRISNVVADVLRPDLARLGYGDGRHGFAITLPISALTKTEIPATIFKNNSDIKLRDGIWKPQKNVGGYATTFSDREYLQWAYLAFEVPAGAYQQSPSVQSFFARNRQYYAALAAGRNERLVSVVMPAFNRAGLIQDSIQSVLDQDYKNWELLIVDDGSSDGTAEFVESFIAKANDQRLKLIRLDKNSGVSRARNVGLERAQGEYVAYLDSDNQWYPDCLRVLVTALEENLDYECAYAGQEIWQALRLFEVVELRSIRANPFNRSKLELRNYIDLNVFIHKRSVYERLGGFNVEMTRLVDWELILRYTKERPAYFAPVLVNKYFVALAQNQITATEKYDENLEKLMKLYSL